MTLAHTIWQHLFSTNVERTELQCEWQTIVYTDGPLSLPPASLCRAGRRPCGTTVLASLWTALASGEWRV